MFLMLNAQFLLYIKLYYTYVYIMIYRPFHVWTKTNMVWIAILYGQGPCMQYHKTTAVTTFPRPEMGISMYLFALNSNHVWWKTTISITLIQDCVSFTKEQIRMVIILLAVSVMDDHCFDGNKYWYSNISMRIKYLGLNGTTITACNKSQMNENTRHCVHR